MKIEKTFPNWFDVIARKHFNQRKVLMNTTIEAEKNVKSVASIFAAMTDQRKLKGIRYQFQPLLILLSLSKLCSQDTPTFQRNDR